MPLYTVTENPPPFTQGESDTTTFDSSARPAIEFDVVMDNRLVSTPAYRIIQSPPIKQKTTTVRTTVINNTTIVNKGDSMKLSAEYENTLLLENISGRTLLSNDGGGPKTYDDTGSPIWDSANMKIVCMNLKEVLDVQLRFSMTSDTLGGAFEIEAYNGSKVDIIEEEINIQEQDFTIRFRIIIDQNSIDNGIQFYITPELGMTVSVNEFSLVIVKG